MLRGHLSEPCPCGSGLQYQACCGKYHQGMKPENALILMRSRYTAYAKLLSHYIIETTHPDNPRAMADPFVWTTEIVAFATNTEFERLEILNFEDGSETAYVTFKAYLKQGGSDATFTELSRFVKVSGRWLYREGQVRR